MKIVHTKLEGVIIIEPDVYSDNRGYFLETWHYSRYKEYSIPENFVQDNLSFSHKNILRGLHFQYPHLQDKLVSVYAGEIFDVAVDVRVGSPKFGQWIGIQLSSNNHWQLFIPKGFAHGFLTLSEEAIVAYKCTEIYYSEHDSGIIWNDPDIHIDWPTLYPIVSAKDGSLRRLQSITDRYLPKY